MPSVGLRNLGALAGYSTFSGSATLGTPGHGGRSFALGQSSTSYITAGSLAAYPTNHCGLIVFDLTTSATNVALFDTHDSADGFYVKVSTSDVIEINKRNAALVVQSSNTVRSGGAINVAAWSVHEGICTVALNGQSESATDSTGYVLTAGPRFGATYLTESQTHRQYLSCFAPDQWLTAGELRSLTLNPWQIFAARRTAAAPATIPGNIAWLIA